MAVVGTWELVAYDVLASDGARTEGPLGPSPRGLLIYGADAHMSVAMMRSGEMRSGPADDAPPAGPAFMGYAGTWRLDGAQVVHDITVASHGYMVGTRQVRELALDGDRLTIVAETPPAAGPPERRVLTWRRAGAGASAGSANGHADGQADGGKP